MSTHGDASLGDDPLGSDHTPILSVFPQASGGLCQFSRGQTKELRTRTNSLPIADVNWLITTPPMSPLDSRI